MKIDQKTFLEFSKLISDRCGIQLAENRIQMLQNRISGRVRQLGLGCYRDYLDVVQSERIVGELDALVDAVTTNYTHFFRDAAQFDHVHDRLAEILKRRARETGANRRIRIWSAACSTGEEAYTLAITAREAADSVGQSGDDIRVLATDIASSVLNKAAVAQYKESSIARLPKTKQKYFESVSKPFEAGENEVVVCDEIRKMVIFCRMNLCEPRLRVPDDIDIIFCRNVLLYFHPNMQQQILEGCSSALRPGGLLYVGACESVRHLIPNMKSVRPSVFQSPVTEHLRDNASSSQRLIAVGGARA